MVDTHELLGCSLFCTKIRLSLTPCYFGNKVNGKDLPFRKRKRKEKVKGKISVSEMRSKKILIYVFYLQTYQIFLLLALVMFQILSEVLPFFLDINFFYLISRKLIDVPSSMFWFRLDTFTSRCSIANAGVDFNHLVTENEVLDDLQSVPSGCSIPIVHLKSDILENEPLKLPTDDTYISDPFTTLPVCIFTVQFSYLASW